MQTRLILLLAFLASTVHAECTMRSASQNISEQRVSAPVDLVKTVQEGSCRVKFRINIDGKWHNVDKEEKGQGSDALCTQAIQNARNELLAQKGGLFQTDSIMRCNEGGVTEFRPVKIGDLVLESELAVVPKNQKYFTHDRSQCRLFRERYEQNGKFRITHGVICKTDHQEWIVVDKW